MPHRQKSKPSKVRGSKLAARAKSAPSRAIVRAATDLSLPERMQAVLIEGDLKPLTVPERMEYYRKVCLSLGLNPLTRPFDYLAFNSKIILYARKDCTDQLRRIHGVSVTKSTRTLEGDLCIVEVEVRDKHGRTDTGIGAWAIAGLKGENAVNAILKAETKAKRRATLSLCGLGMLDSSELDTIEYDEVSATGRVVEVIPAKEAENPALTAYEQREAENVKKLSPAQREVVERKIAEAKQKASPDLQPADRTGAAVTGSGAGDAPTAPATYDGLTCTAIENGWYRIEGPEDLLKKHRDVLKPLWRVNAKPPGILVEGSQFGKLCRLFEEAKTKFRIV